LISCLLQGSSLGKFAKLFKLTTHKSPSSPFSMELHSTKQSDIDMFEFLISENSYCAEKIIRDLKFDPDVVITSITRNGKILLPRGAVKLLPEDILFILAPLSRHHELRLFLSKGPISTDEA
jgi:cell volume regulation protein A